MGFEISGVGSLPHTDVGEAVAFVDTTTTIPYVPQLPQRHPSEGMIVQWGDGLCGCGPGGAYGLVHGAAYGNRAEAESTATTFLTGRRDAVIKTQATGPITLGLAMLRGGADMAVLWDGLVAGLIERIDSHIATIQRQVPGVSVVLILDEPLLAAWGSERGPDADLGLVRDVLGAVIDGVSVRPGVHCCGDPDWAMIAGLAPRWFSWDVANLGPGFTDRVDSIADAIGNGTGVMWGVAPTSLNPMLDIETLVTRYQIALTRLVAAGAPLGRMHINAWYTPGCGLAGTTVPDAAHVMHVVHDVADRIHSTEDR